MKKAHHRIRRFCAILIGLVFLASGLLKLLDPVGTGLIVSEYLKFFHMNFLQGAAKGLGMILSVVEAGTGAALVSGVFRKTTAIITSALILFFTISRCNELPQKAIRLQPVSIRYLVAVKAP